jgi:uncharacterized membrane protein (UPF0182 family)
LKKRALTVLAVILFMFFFLFFNRIINFVINIEWFKEVGYLTVYFTKLIAIAKLMVPILIVCFVTITLYYRSLRKNIVKWRKVVEVDPAKEKLEKKVFYIANFLLSLMLSYSFATTNWYTILQFGNAVSFNQKDPIFGLDVSFYVFKLPLIQSLFSTMISLLFMLLVITFMSYFLVSARVTLDGTIRMKRMPDFKTLQNDIIKFAGRQLAVVAFLFMITLSVGYALKAVSLVFSTTGVTFGASYTDIHVSLLFFKVIVVVSLVAAVVIFASLMTSKSKPIVISVIVIMVLVAAETVTSFSMQRFIVKSNEKTLEQPYIQYNIDATRKAYNIDEAETSSFPVTDDITTQDIAANQDTIDNIRINSYEPALEFYNQVQIIRYYYTFNDLDLDRYVINGKYNQVFIAPRELDSEAVEPDTWQNKHLIYTHGYGLAMNKVNSITSEGQPDFVIKDIPPANATDLAITNPRIYYGEKTNEYAIVNTKISEFDYPAGSDMQTTTYQEDAGISMTFMMKILFAIHEGDMNFLLSRDITDESKILINRNIVERVQKIAPFLTLDSDPYAVLSDGKIYWIMDAYTTSSRYPYSQPQGGINYIRNSVKVIVDAVDGSTDFYIVDKEDPIAASYAKIFPGLFKDLSTLSDDLRLHFKYPDDIFQIQSTVLGKYHVTDPGVFYNGEDVWEVAKAQREVEGELKKSEAPYMVMKLPGFDKEEMILLQYFNIRSKDNMAALYCARMDGDNYGKMLVYTFPAQKTIYSPYLFKQKVNQDTTISKELALWNKEGSEVIFGDTIIVPINHSLLYIEPMYLRASGESSIPEVKRIIVSYSDKIILADSVESALLQLFQYQESGGQTGTETGTPTNMTEDQLAKVQEAKSLYEKAIEAQKNGDWTGYGSYIQQLGELLQQLNQ